MERINILHVSASLFLLSYFFNVFVYRSSDKLVKSKYFDVIPFIAIIGISNSALLLSDFYVYKLALFIYFSVQALSMIFTRVIENSVLHLLAYILSIVLLLMVGFNLMIPIQFLNISNILLMGIIILIQFRNYNHYKTAMHKEISEIYLIALIGVIILSYGHTYFLMSFGLLIYAVFQLSEISILLKFYKMSRASIDVRLADLERKFERTVEFEAKKRTSVMADKVEHIKESSQKDPMTKALNRNGLTSVINDLINDSSVKIFSIAMFDIDKFKTINDTKGHMVGDECLKYLSYAFMINNRKTDFLGRYGGDEFVFVMPHINAPGALEISERMRIEIQNKSAPKFTISMGISTYPYDGKNFSALIEIADQGLYAAKEAGRNQVKYKGNVFTKG
ncbi:GGDEF domain-containing protein [Fusibacter sp. 3D3]|uniref:GGDEF domain-containing protein n=1 Tax=Fusibacter sp. 3D3 TaxID=1048380 RepID=UPI000853C847|nr:GGDEF domain-containing protein [Fusibacter sp. 3D3]GAU77358.1 GAF domain/GGDEF domain protein [Fusibacter sp. 3D3]